MSKYPIERCLFDNEPHILGIMDCFRVEKYNNLTEIKP